MVEIKGIYKCGHSWTTIVNSGTKQEVKMVLDRYKYKVCPKCEEKAENKAGA